MIVTVTPNPSVDRTIALPGRLERGEVHRVAEVSDQPGGKGINISRACVGAGIATVAVLPAEVGSPYLRSLADAGVPTAPVAPAGPMRVNLAITEPDGTTTKLNAAGARVTPADLEAIALAALAVPAEWAVLAGSLPPGADPGWYAELAGRLRAAGRRVAVDTSDAALSALVARLERDTAPALLKPNAEELADIVGVPARVLEGDPERVALAAADLVRRGVSAVLATAGGAGAVLVTEAGAWHAAPPRIRVVSTVGAGDSSLFGYLLADLAGAEPADRLASAVAWGAAAASLPGTTVPVPSQLRTDEVRVRRLGTPMPSRLSNEGVPTWQN